MDRMQLARLSRWAEILLTVLLLAVVVQQCASFAAEGRNAAPSLTPVFLVGGLLWLLSGLRNWLLAAEVAKLNSARSGHSSGLALLGRRYRDPAVLTRTGKVNVVLGALWIALAFLNT